MLINYIRIAWRIILRQKLFSLVNIIGLATGMAACLLIVQYISFELSFDNFHSNGRNIYRIKYQNYSQGNLIENTPKTFSAVGPALKANFPEVTDFTRVNKLSGMVSVQRPDGSLLAFNEDKLYQADASFFKIFSFPMVEGTRNALNEPNTIAISESTARKYFHAENAIGKTIRIQQQASGTDIKAIVTGIFKDVPANSHLQFDFVVSGNNGVGDWVYPDFYTYVQLAPGTDPKLFDAKLPDFIKRNAVAEGAKTSSFTQGKTNINSISLSLQPLRDIHLYSNLSNEIGNSGNGKMVWYLGLVAVLILVIAYINYVNLTTARVVDRAREVGIRKVLGSRRLQLIKQFLFESLLLNIISVVAAIVITLFSMPWFSKLCGAEIHFTLWKDIYFAAGFIALLAVGVLLSAAYPAIVLSDYKPVQVLKGKFMNSSQSISLRKALVVFQFAATAAFLMGTLVVYRQVNFMKDANKGMNMKQTLVVVAPQNIRATDADNLAYMAKDSVFQNEVSRIHSISGVSASTSIPGQAIDFILAYTSHAQTASEKTLRLSTLEIGAKYLSQFNIKVIAGTELPDNTNRRYPALLLNEASVNSLGFKNAKDAVGKFIQTRNGRGRIFQNEIVGVVQNFHQTSLKDDYTPIVFRTSDPNSTTYYQLKVNTANMAQTIARVEKTYKSVYSGSAFQYFFLDEFFDQQYKTEQHFGKVFTLFSGFAIFVACLGLFGLTLITITQRMKEIGIRKVLGASVSNIILLVSKDFASLIVIANLIALPLAYWGCERWLQTYKFRITINAWGFVLPVITVFMIAILTVSYQSVKAALANPVKSLRNE
ncbi:MAG TPA: ABC transporter permease [Mucilaginibacter sp.]|nr:ABC transporter permease [Mucilaginibacter sp.]